MQSSRLFKLSIFFVTAVLAAAWQPVWATWDNVVWDQAVWDQTTPIYQVTPSVNGSGSIDPSTPQTITENESATLVLTPTQGHRISGVTGSCGGTLTNSTFTTDPVTADCSVEANFELIPVYWSVSPSAGTGGTITPSSNQQILDGATTQFTVTPNSGYEIADVAGTCGGSLSGNTYTTNTIATNCSVEVTFSLIPVYYDVTLTAAPNGALSSSTVQSILEGETATFTLTPDANYGVSSVGGTCGGTLTGLSYTTNAITQACSVVPVFELLSGTVPPDAPTLSKVGVTESSATLQISPSAIGSDPISGYETQCSIENVSARSALQAPAKDMPIALGYFDASKGLRAGTKKGRTFVANPGLSGLARGMVLRVEKQGGGFNDFKIDRDSSSQQGNRFAASDAGNGDWIRLLVREDGNFFGSYVIDGVAYEARIEADKTLIYSTADGTLADNPFEGDALSHNWEGESEPQARQAAELTANPTVVTLGILYDNALAGLEAVDRLLWIDWLVTSANDIYQNSGVDLAFKVVLLQQYEPGTSLTIEQRLRMVSCNTSSCGPSGVVNPTVNGLRLATGADMVAQLVGVGTGGTCGIGWITPSESYMADPSILYHFTYSVSALINGNGTVCPSNVLAHELGHNFSLNHDRDTLVAPPYPPTAFSYAFGHRIDGGARGSMMSYPTSGFAGYLPYLSNPSISIDSQSLGVQTGQTNEAFSALAVAQVDGYYEALFNNGSGADLLIPPPPILLDLTSTTTNVEVTFLPDKLYGQPTPQLFTANCSGTTASGSSSPITVTGLQSGTSYSCSVTASNEFGASQPSTSGVIETQIQAYTVSPSAGTGGAISPSTPQQVAQGNTTSFTVTPSSGFNIDTVTGCSGSLVGTIYTTGAITANCSVTASFVEQPTNEFTVTASAGAGGSITPNGAQVITVGETISFMVTPDTDYGIAGVAGCNGTLNGNTYTTDAISADCSVQATFSQETWRVSGLSTTAQFNGLPTGENFACSTVATNLAGDSPASNIVRLITQAPSAPSAPVITNTDYGDGEITLTVSVTNSGGVSLDYYTADCGGITGVSDVPRITVEGLENDVEYACTVTATNTSGITSTASTPVSITPEALPTGLPIWLLYEATK